MDKKTLIAYFSQNGDTNKLLEIIFRRQYSAFYLIAFFWGGDAGMAIQLFNILRTLLKKRLSIVFERGNKYSSLRANVSERGNPEK